MPCILREKLKAEGTRCREKIGNTAGEKRRKTGFTMPLATNSLVNMFHTAHFHLH